MKKNFVSLLAKPDRSKRIWEKILSYLHVKQWILLIACCITVTPNEPILSPADHS